MYDQREKALRDYEWAMSSAKEEGREEGLEEGREEGLEQGFVVGKLVGEILILEELVGDQIGRAHV